MRRPPIPLSFRQTISAFTFSQLLLLCLSLYFFFRVLLSYHLSLSNFIRLLFSKSNHLPSRHTSFFSLLINPLLFHHLHTILSSLHHSSPLLSSLLTLLSLSSLHLSSPLLSSITLLHLSSPLSSSPSFTSPLLFPPHFTLPLLFSPHHTSPLFSSFSSHP